MADTVQDRVSKLFVDHREKRISDREFNLAIRDFSAAELNQLAQLALSVSALPAEHFLTK
jgi:hypothetical protein